VQQTPFPPQKVLRAAPQLSKKRAKHKIHPAHPKDSTKKQENRNKSCVRLPLVHIARCRLWRGACAPACASISWRQWQKIRERRKNHPLHLNSAPVGPLLFQKMAIWLHSEGRAAAPCQAQSVGGSNSYKLESVKKREEACVPSPHSLSLFCQMRAPAKPRPPFSARCSTLLCLPPDTR
jgi:hypothetical protein